ncbi:oligosaccharide flippase family protein [Dechloromonas sp. ZS-1]|uniref:oligosaccharide flippase family protein n=1 Tax=Dechloromonas sp. ZS-1 TaxID=3138067 RepID=UPI0031FDF8F3
MSLLKNAGFNLLGAVVPALLAIFTIPYIVSILGSDNYGLLALITSIVGYFSLLDINITASSTKYVSQYNASGDKNRLNETICFGVLIYAGIGLVGMFGLYFSAHTLISSVFALPIGQQFDAVAAIQIAALGFFVGQIQSYLQSLPGALMRYDISGRIEACFGTIVPLLTIGLLYSGFGLVELVWLRVLMSLLQALLICYMLRELIPEFRWATPSKDICEMIMSFSAYSFLSRLAALTYANADKIIIGARVSVTALTFYVVPVTLANRVMSLVFRLSGVMFPHASTLAAQGRLDELESDYLLASRYIFFLNGAIALLLATMAYPILSLWLTPEFAQAGGSVMVMITLAQWVDSLTNLPSLVNDGLGRPKVSGLFALMRAALGLALIFVGVCNFGIEGAAAAHLLSSIVMSLAFVLYVHGRTVPVAISTLCLKAYKPTLIILIPVALIGMLLMPLAQRGWMQLIASGSVMGMILVLGGLWKVCLPKHRKLLLSRFGIN